MRSTDLMGLGMNALLALRLGDDPFFVTVAGATAAAATQLPGSNSIVVVNASNSGSGIKLPAVGGDTGCLPGDDITILNNIVGTIYVYAANNGNGSAVALVGNGASNAGTTGVSLLASHVMELKAINISTWLFIKSSV